MRRILRIVCFAGTLLLIGLGVGSANEFRQWTDVLGRNFEARLVEVKPTMVRLANREGNKLLDSYDKKGNYTGPTRVMQELEKMLSE